MAFSPDAGDGPMAGQTRPAHSTGIAPAQELRAAIAAGEIAAELPIGEDQVQPASLDLRLGPIAYRVRASFLPGRQATVGEKLARLAMHRIDLSAGAVLEKNCVYIVPLMERLALRKRSSALANPKSSTGRLDVFARVITDHGVEFDRIAERYCGPLYAEICPRTFSILVHPGSRLVQLRLRRGSPAVSDTAMRRLHEEVGLLGGPSAAADIRNGVAFTVDLEGRPDSPVIGWRARKHVGLIEVDRIDHYDPLDFWEPVLRQDGGGIVLNPEDFYILATKETVVVPPDHAAEMLAYDTLVGEFRVHYAGFFDPGFGSAETEGTGSRAVLEVRAHEVPFMLEHGQVVGRLIYERLMDRPDKLYGAGIGSSYQRQGLALGKQFRRASALPSSA